MLHKNNKSSAVASQQQIRLAKLKLQPAIIDGDHMIIVTNLAVRTHTRVYCESGYIKAASRQQIRLAKLKLQPAIIDGDHMIIVTNLAVRTHTRVYCESGYIKARGANCAGILKVRECERRYLVNQTKTGR